MKADEAIEILKTWRITGDKAHEALDMAIEALAKDINVPTNDCISREAAIDALVEGFKRIPTLAIRAKDMIEQLPSAQPERKKGKWTKDNACEFCGFKPWYEGDIHTLSYCPNCGAKMKGGQDEADRR